MKQSAFHISKKKVFEAAKQAAYSLGLEIRNSSLSDGTLELFSNGGLFSFGNKIDLEIISKEPAENILKVTSISAAAIQVIDWGTNNDLETKIIEEVKTILNG
jgi:hypothetical protein